ncbi:zinc-dependent peptidase [Luteolibacter marinus]|uniref:zinc-dependent peptidase n=1 Tax=Luteolibacter marinus TaxID=2776705 RepID=UPI001867AB5F|nr:hypothetical protein [Luteolibacter marinus]
MLLRRLLLALTLCPAISMAGLTADDYETASIAGWTVHIEKSLADHPRRQAALDLLETKLKEVAGLVPGAALPKLRQVPIWLSRNADQGACYHPSVDWLRNNGRVVEMARSIELQNIDHFIDWAPTQPLMVLHELAHAWHDRVLPDGYANAEIRKAFDRAVATKDYENVKRANGKLVRHYALSNEKEYFAECSEAYFGRNDFQPFEREELKSFDPSGYALVEKMWGLR